MVLRISLCLTVLAVCAPGQAVDEYQMKAAFLYNFVKFVKWPPQTFRTPSDPFTICIFGPNPFGSALEEATGGNVIEGRRLVIQQLNAAQPSCNCQILFVAAQESKRFRFVASRLQETGVLAVGESEGFADDGGVINFKIERGRLHFEINVIAAERAHLQISSKLLSLAQIVRK
jgi:hypothetical protein